MSRKTANFTSYTKDSFGEEDQRRLAKVFCELDAKHCNVMLSNSDTDFIRGLYKGYIIPQPKTPPACCGDEGITLQLQSLYFGIDNIL